MACHKLGNPCTECLTGAADGKRFVSIKVNQLHSLSHCEVEIGCAERKQAQVACQPHPVHRAVIPAHTSETGTLT